MAIRSRKDKLIEEAQKFVLRSQYDKAAKIYEQILELEPSAINLRQKLAELLIKCGRNDDARKEFETIGKHFSKNGFYLKAIAVYKQLQKLFISDISITLTLADLNEKHGLNANALSEYKLVYEFHEKSGNSAESLRILERMQSIDPQNIPIKIKLAETYAQRGKKKEAYALFAKAASLLLNRGDNATLAKVSARIQQLFPERQDIMLEILADQLREGNAASAIESIQSLLRSDPHNKRAWDLIVQAYQQLKQPQRVRIAYQHYLKFFPAEPEAMIGLIESVTVGDDLATALELLDQYESTLISAGFLPQLTQIYISLEKLDPVNARILEGHLRVATANGNDSEIRSLSSKLQSLTSVPVVAKSGTTVAELPPAIIDEQLLEAAETLDSPFFDAADQEQTPISDSVDRNAEASSASDSSASPFDTAGETFPPPDDVSSSSPFDAADNTLQPPDEEFEIDIEIDLDSPFGPPGQEAEPASTQDNWLDSVGDLFDSIITAPSGIKFGNEVNNSDAQSHYDLGLAFKEMGLYDEAINEFRQASQDPLRLVECLVMQCVCLRERGEPEKAVTMLQALLKPGLGEDEYCAITYELASAYEAVGNKEEANILLHKISATNPDFRDISSRINAANLSESLDFSDDELKDF